LQESGENTCHHLNLVKLWNLKKPLLNSNFDSTTRQKAPFGAVALLFLLLICLFPEPFFSGNGQGRVYATSVNSSTQALPRKVTIDTYVISIGNLNEVEGTFSADFYLSFAWSGNWSLNSNNSSQPALPENFEFMNGNIDQLTQITAEQNISGSGYNYLSYRVSGTFFDTFNFSRYPLDTQKLSIEIENNNFTVATLIFVPSSQSTIDPDANVSGWIINHGSSQEYVTTHYYNTSFAYPVNGSGSQNQTYSRAIFSITVQRPLISAALELLIPIIVLTLLAMLSIKIRSERLESSTAIFVASIFTSVAFLLNFNSSVPPIGYFTLADDIIIVLFGVLLYALSIRIILHNYEPKPPKSLVAVYRASFFAIPVAVAVACLALLFL
jgi:hypothetical protein